MSAARRLPLLLLPVLLGCATNGGLRRVETQVAVLRMETARRDSARAAELDRIIAIQDRLLDSLSSTQQALRSFRLATAADLTDINRQLVQIQELTGQSQLRLSQLRADLEARIQAGMFAPPVVPPPEAGDTLGAPATPVASANQMYQAARLQYQRNSLGTARLGFHQFLAAYPNDPQVPDALYWLAETFQGENPDSAVAYYGQVVSRFASSPRAATSLYKVGRVAEDRNDVRGARTAYERLLRDFPRSDEAPLARERLNALRP